MREEVIQCPHCQNPAVRIDNSRFECLKPTCNRRFRYDSSYSYTIKSNSKSNAVDNTSTASGRGDSTHKAGGVGSSASHDTEMDVIDICLEVLGVIKIILIIVFKGIAIVFKGIFRFIGYIWRNRRTISANLVPIFYISPFVALAISVIVSFINVKKPGSPSTFDVYLLIGAWSYFCIVFSILFRNKK